MQVIRMTCLTTIDDRTLIERTLAGERECFDLLVHRHTAAVRKRVTMIVRNTADHDDVVQETFLKAWRHLASFHSKSSFRTWLTHIAANEALMQLRRQTRIAEPAIGLDQCASDHASPLEQVLLAETRRNVRTAVDRLPEKYRRALITRDLEERTTEETATHLRLCPALVKTHVFRARRMLSAGILQERAA
jgi:RNA polymerase sigma-70 factor, ECF subfamily